MKAQSEKLKAESQKKVNTNQGRTFNLHQKHTPNTSQEDGQALRKQPVAGFSAERDGALALRTFDFPPSQKS